MVALNPMFDDSKKNKQGIGSGVRKKPITKEQGRKVRKDKKWDVKIPLTLEERRLLKRLGSKYKMTPTELCSDLVKRGLKSGIEFEEVNYLATGKVYPAKLEKEYKDLLFELTVEWDCSYRKAAHRILIGILELERGYL